MFLGHHGGIRCNSLGQTNSGLLDLATETTGKAEIKAQSTKEMKRTFSPSCFGKQYFSAANIFVTAACLTKKKKKFAQKCIKLLNTIKNGANSVQECALSCDQAPCLLFSKEKLLQLLPSPIPFVAHKQHWG